MEYLQQEFSVRFAYKVFFTTHLFDAGNTLFKDFLLEKKSAGLRQKILFVIDSGVAQYHPQLAAKIKNYFSGNSSIQLIDDIMIIPGGEAVKNDDVFFQRIVEAVNKYGIDRHSYLVAIGGGAVLDLAGYAAAVSHRGIRHIRIPTTVLSQNDSGVGVKNGINYFGKKNFLGTFAPPVAVFNDYHFLTTLEDVDWLSGISEAIKVALIRDPEFFVWLEEHAELLANRDLPAMQYLVKRCAQLHMEHIASRDPFESGTSRPLDFGHWSAHKLEQLTDFSIRHGEAVAIGIALDSTYSHLAGMLAAADLERILNLFRKLRLVVCHPLMEIKEENSPILQGLNEFREHLGGQLTIMLLRGIGKGEEANEMNVELITEAGRWLIHREESAIVSLAKS
jgi:3-dehydroquinate synthase